MFWISSLFHHFNIHFNFTNTRTPTLITRNTYWKPKITNISSQECKNLEGLTLCIESRLEASQYCRVKESSLWDQMAATEAWQPCVTMLPSGQVSIRSLRRTTYWMTVSGSMLLPVSLPSAAAAETADASILTLNLEGKIGRTSCTWGNGYDSPAETQRRESSDAITEGTLRSMKLMLTPSFFLLLL